MKKMYSFLALAGIGISASAQVNLPYSDTFTYADGNLVGNGGWSYLGTPVTQNPDEIKVVNGTVKIDGIGNDVQQTFATPVNSGTISYGFDLTVNDLQKANSADGGYFAGFVQSGTTYGGTVWIKKVTDTTFKIGIEVRTGANMLTTWTTAEYSINTTYKIVVAYTFNAGSTSDDTVTLYVNGGEAAKDTHTGTDLTMASSFFLRQDSEAETPAMTLDNLKISTSSLLGTAEMNRLAAVLIKNSVVEKTIIFGAKSEVKIYSVTGQLVKSAAVADGTALDVSALAKGVYIVTGEVDGMKVSQKIVKK